MKWANFAGIFSRPLTASMLNIKHSISKYNSGRINRAFDEFMISSNQAPLFESNDEKMSYYFLIRNTTLLPQSAQYKPY